VAGAPPAEERGGLSRRVPGRNLPSGAGPAEQRDPAPVDPAAAKAEADAFSQGFARGVASVPGSARPTEVPGPAPAEMPGPPQWPLSAAIPSQRSPLPSERIMPGSPADVPAAPAAGTTGQTPAAVPDSPAPVSSAPVSPAPVSSAPVSSAPVSSASAGAGFVHNGQAPADAAGAPGAASTPAEAARYPLPSRRVPGSTRDSWDIGDTQPVPPVPQPAPLRHAASFDDGQLTRRVPGSHLAGELRKQGAVPPASVGGAPPPGRTQAPVDRDPQSEQLLLNALVAGFARGNAAAETGGDAPGHNPDARPATQHPPEQTPSYQYDSGTPNGAEPQNVERR
jgi:hypothetical protein